MNWVIRPLPALPDDLNMAIQVAAGGTYNFQQRVLSKVHGAGRRNQ